MTNVVILDVMAEAAKNSGQFEEALRAVQELPSAQLIDLADAIAARLEELEDSLPLSEHARREIEMARKEHAHGQTTTLDDFLRMHG